MSKYIQNDQVVFPATTLAFSFHAIRTGKEQETAAKLQEIGASVEEFKDNKNNSRMRRKPCAVAVSDYSFTEKQLGAILENTIRSVIRATLEEIQIEEIEAEDLAELLDADLFSTGGSGVSLSKDEREALAAQFGEYLTTLEVPEQGRAILKGILQFAASDARLKDFGNWDSQKERVTKGCSITIGRLEGFRDAEADGLEAAYLNAVIERIKNYIEKGPKKAKQEKDVLELL